MNLNRTPTCRLPLVVCALLLVAGSGLVLSGDIGGPYYERETPDDQPADLKPVDNPEARSAARSVVFGSYVSVQVNVDSLGQNILGDAGNETSIAVDPNDPDSIVIGWRQFDSITSNFRQGGWAYSTDGGSTWNASTLTPGTFRSDPVVGFDGDGAVYYHSLSTDPFLNQVFKSLDGGTAWLPPVDAFGGDKNWLVADDTGGPGDGNVYGIWQRFFGCCGLDTLTRSTDGGAIFEDPVDVDLFPTFGTMAIGPDGELYAAGIDGQNGQDLSTFVVSRSDSARDASATPVFSGVQVNLGGSMSVSDGPNPAGLLGQANVAVDRSAGPTRGFVYLLASVEPNGSSDPLDVQIARSMDGGQTWSAPIRVNTPAAGWQWFGAHSVAPNGRIDVIWNDTRNSGLENVSQLYYSYSWDAGNTWSKNVPVSPSFDSHVGFPNQDKIGDYYTILSDAAGAGVAYAATFNGEQDVYYVNVFPDCNQNTVSDVIDIDGGSSPDCNTNHIPDECEPGLVCTPSGAVPDGSLGQQPPLVVDRLAGSMVRLSWSESCATGDGDYEVYEGTVGGRFTSHLPRLCSTGGATTVDLSPGGPDVYYLVVPRNTTNEGSYGFDSAGTERYPSLGACLDQSIGACE